MIWLCDGAFGAAGWHYWPPSQVAVVQEPRSPKAAVLSRSPGTEWVAHRVTSNPSKGPSLARL